MKIVLAEWAAYAPRRDKWVGQQRVCCGLGRMLERMRRYDPGLPVDVILVINTERGKINTERGEAGAEEPVKHWWSSLQHRRRQGRMQRSIARRLRGYSQLLAKYPFMEAVCFRDNHGQDFGAYDFGYQLLQGQRYRGEVLFMNSSVAGPNEHGWLLKYRAQFRRHPDVGLCGIGLNSHDTSREPSPFAPHVQSYFLFTNMPVLERAVGTRLLDRDVEDKLDIIRHGEIGVSARVLEAGYSITSPAFPNFAYRDGHAWSIPCGDLRYSSEYPVPANRI